MIGFDDALVRNYAKIFATEFKNQGMFGGSQTTDGMSDNANRERKDDLSYKKADKQRKDQLKQGNKLIRQADTLYAQGKRNIKVLKEASDLRKRGEKIVNDANKKYSSQVRRIAHTDLKKFSDGLRVAKENALDTGRQLFTFTAATTAATTAITKLANDFRAQLEFGATGGLLTHLNAALRMGVDPELLSELQSRNRASVIAMGGVEQWSNKLADSQRNLYTYIGDLDKTTRFTAESLQTMRMAGIDPTIEALKVTAPGLRTAADYTATFGDTIRDISIISGQTFEEVNGMMREYVENEQIRFRLSSTMDKNRRREMLVEIATRHKLLLGLGMTADQAKQAAMALEQIAGEGPMARIKKAAKLQAMMGMMGMAGEGAKAAGIMRKGRRASPAEQADLAKILGAGKQRMAATARGDIGSEMAFFNAMDKMGLDSLLGPNGPIDTALGESYGPQQASAAHLSTIGESNQELVTATYEASRILKGIKDHPYFYGALALLSTIGLGVASISRMMAIGSIMGGKGGAGMANVARSGVMSTLGKIAKFGAPLAVAVGTIRTLTETTEESAKQVGAFGDMLGGTDLGNKILSGLQNIGNAATFGIAGWLGEALGNAGANKQTTIKQTQSRLDAAFVKMSVQKDNQLDTAAVENAQLNDIKILLETLNMSNEKFGKLSEKQIDVLAGMASDGEITKEEVTKANKMTKNPRRTNSGSKSL